MAPLRHSQKRVFLAAAAALAAFALLPAPGFCQEGAPAGPIQPAPGVKPEAPPSAEQLKHAIRTRVDEVVAPVTVRDASGEMVLNLAKENFHIYDNGSEQKIDSFEVGGEPFSIVLAVETSSHIAPMFPAVEHTGIVFTEAVMGQTSEAAVVTFDDSVRVVGKFTTDPDTIERDVRTLATGTEGSRLYDAMDKGIELLEERPEARRRILLIVGEAQDTGSESRLGEVLRRAELANVTIYSVALSTAMADLRNKRDPYQSPEVGPPGTYPEPTPNGQPRTPELEQQVGGNIDYLALAIWLIKTGKNAVLPSSLAIASKATGGMNLSVKKDRSIEKAMDAIGGELHAQYTVSYRPTGGVLSGYHEIQVTVDRPRVTVRSRPGYYIPPPES
jgi:VWFA-related protein